MAAFENFPVKRTVLFHFPPKRLRISSRNTGTDGCDATSTFTPKSSPYGDLLNKIN